VNTEKKLAVFTAFAAMVFLIALFAPYLTPYDPDAQDLSQALMAPCQEHMMGTDRFGRDMLSRVIMGTRSSVFSVLALVEAVAASGTAIGVYCGYFGGKADTVVMRFADICLAFPGMVFAIAIAGVMGGGITNAVLALAVISWPKYARLARGQVLSMQNSTYIQAAQMSGSGPWKVILRHILPNILGAIFVTAVLDIGTMMMEIAGLSFLGLGAMPPTAEWGSMMSNGRSMIQTSPWVILAPGCAIFITVMIFNLLGDTIRDYLDPRRKLQSE